jgi:hypothetical protein
MRCRGNVKLRSESDVPVSSTGAHVTSSRIWRLWMFWPDIPSCFLSLYSSGSLFSILASYFAFLAFRYSCIDLHLPFCVLRTLLISHFVSSSLFLQRIVRMINQWWTEKDLEESYRLADVGMSSIFLQEYWKSLKIQVRASDTRLRFELRASPTQVQIVTITLVLSRITLCVVSVFPASEPLISISVKTTTHPSTSQHSHPVSPV